ncbi:hypothetical protein EJ03DRAFT_219183 [Teratosphaeria nubilosa]|uniref:Uncharacterized protein n=1 Tax=Teratosphaeria nubilosa TaxID=161662 RepID=A0A6G1KWY0_9PEZI|nr:hypothetical protein EJ03DRAFT_219183 [Teratosphaeria nubilosa]
MHFQHNSSRRRRRSIHISRRRTKHNSNRRPTFALFQAPILSLLSSNISRLLSNSSSSSRFSSSSNSPRHSPHPAKEDKASSLLVARMHSSSRKTLRPQQDLVLLVPTSIMRTWRSN